MSNSGYYRQRPGVIRPREFQLERTRMLSAAELKDHGLHSRSRRRLLFLVAWITIIIALLNYFQAFNFNVGTSYFNNAVSDEKVLNNLRGQENGDDSLKAEIKNVNEKSNDESELDYDDDEDSDNSKDKAGIQADVFDDLEDEVDDDSDLDESDSEEQGLEEEDDEEEDTELGEPNLKVPNNLDSQQNLIPKAKLSLDSYLHNTGNRAVDIPSQSSFSVKFVLLKATDTLGKSALLVKACPVISGSSNPSSDAGLTITSAGASSPKCFHPTAFKMAKNNLERYGISADILGGGRISRHYNSHSHRKRKGERNEHVISVFGYSKSYKKLLGNTYKSDTNKVTCDLISQHFKLKGQEITVRWSNEGYAKSDEYKIKEFITCS